MNNDGQDSLDTLANGGADSLDTGIVALSKQMDLGRWFSRNEFSLLHEAALRAALCNSALNGSEPGGIAANLQAEAQRHARELGFLEARDALFASPGWQDLPGAQQARLATALLSVAVSAGRFRW
ncbi:MAG TPA: hypothetical protein VHI52_20825 [Verrucomicrobiae bacterium]|nr:hypothetical protein [Verrucomicrobiae bacterium]